MNDRMTWLEKLRKLDWPIFADLQSEVIAVIEAAESELVVCGCKEGCSCAALSEMVLAKAIAALKKKIEEQ